VDREALYQRALGELLPSKLARDLDGAAVSRP
jgi:hypothetical protein